VAKFHAEPRRLIATEKSGDQLGDLVRVGRGGEVAGVEQVQLGLGQIVEVGSRAVGGKESTTRSRRSSSPARWWLDSHLRLA
jgi:hypothetical protein